MGAPALRGPDGWIGRSFAPALLALSLLCWPLLAGRGEAAAASAPPAGIIGVLKLPELFGSGPCDRYEAKAVPVFASLSHAQRPAALLQVTRPWRFPVEGGCEGLQVDVVPAAGPAATLPTVEFAYEQPAAIVLERRGRWHRIALPQSPGWVRSDDAQRFIPVERLLMDAMAHLEPDVTVLLQPRPGRHPASGSVELRRERPMPMPVQVLGFRRVDGEPWVRIRIEATDICSREPVQMAGRTGWLPLYDPLRRPVVWFSARGC